MGVYIRGMEMPTKCADCLFIDYFKGQWYCHSINDILETGSSKRDERCNLVPVPPHGRLIDADAYEALIRGLGNREYRRENGTICDAIKFLHPHYAPTIIPASEEGEI